MSRVVLPEIGNEYWSYFSLVMADDVLKRILETNSFYLGDTPAPKNACHNALRFFNLALKGGEDYYPIYSEETYGTFHIARNAPNYFSGLLVAGLVILVISQSFVNIGSMLGVVPLVGVPLLFISHGGTALWFALIEAGIILQVSKYCKN